MSPNQRAPGYHKTDLSDAEMSSSRGLLRSQCDVYQVCVLAGMQRRCNTVSLAELWAGACCVTTVSRLGLNLAMLFPELGPLASDSDSEADHDLSA